MASVDGVLVRSFCASACLVAAACGADADSGDKPPNTAGSGASGTAAGVAGTSGGFSGSAAGAAPASGGVSGSSVIGGSAGTPALGGSGASGQAAQCAPATPVLDPRNTGTITLPIEFVAGNAPLVLGVSVSPQTGKPYSISTLALFFSEVALVSADGAEVPVQLTNVTHAPLPYNVLFVNADAEPRPSLALAAPPGAYAGLVLGVGLPVHCNQGDPSKRVAPLNYDTGMFWTWGTQYVFFKAEGKYTDTATGFAYHMGFDMNYRRVKLTGSVAVTAADSVGPTLRVDLDPVVGGAPDDAAAVAHLSGQAWLANILESKPALALQR